MRIRRVLLVCSGNTCRSPIAAALLSELWRQRSPGGDLEVNSAGTGAFPDTPASLHAIEHLRSMQIDLSGHRSKSVSDLQLEAYDLVLTMTVQHREYILSQWPQMQGRVYTLGEYAGTMQEVPDPFGGSLERYQETATALESMLLRVVQRFCAERGDADS